MAARRAPTAEDFWAYSLTLYGRPGVEAACLRLQEKDKLNVNLVLYCCWLGAQGYELTREEALSSLAAIRPWQERLVEPLRQARRGLKTLEISHEEGDPNLREEILRLELEGERLLQSALCARFAQVFPPIPTQNPGAELARRNLVTYVEAVNISLNEETESCLSDVLAAGFPV